MCLKRICLGHFLYNNISIIILLWLVILRVSIITMMFVSKELLLWINSHHYFFRSHFNTFLYCVRKKYCCFRTHFFKNILEILKKHLLLCRSYTYSLGGSEFHVVLFLIICFLRLTFIGNWESLLVIGGFSFCVCFGMMIFDYI